MWLNVARLLAWYAQMIYGMVVGYGRTQIVERETPTLSSLPSEVLDEVASYLSRADLASLSLVDRSCSAISRPHLWRTLPSLAPIITLLPRECFAIDEFVMTKSEVRRGRMTYCSHERRTKIQYLRALDIQNDCWKRNPRLLQSASHVQRLYLRLSQRSATHSIYDRKGTIHIDLTNFIAFAESLAQCGTASTLFPNLRTLEVDCSSEDGLPARLLLPFTSPRLSVFSTNCLVSGMDDHPNWNHVTEFRFAEPRLEGRVLNSSVAEIPMFTAIQSRIRAVRTLDLCLHRARGLHALLSQCSRTLCSLSLTIASGRNKRVDSFALYHLRRLTLRGQSGAFASALLGSPHLQLVDVQPSLSRGESDFTGIVDRIARGCRNDALQRVRIVGKARVVWSLAMHHIDPLTTFGNLVELEVRASSHIALGDADYDLLAQRLPRLHVFKVSDIDFAAAPREPPQRPATLHALVSFATRCPDLRQLSLEIHEAETVPSLAEGLLAVTLPTKASQVDELGVGSGGKAISPADVASFLRLLFPSLRHLKVSQCCDREAWNAVEKMVMAPKDAEH
ncbi:uncharacterized protein SCHCODRAFT_02579404 [Schizophyllum commune H4-8]|nr:uncharacterized protein SCHCODRAFT_02579404 [Schizophyllum commune H4-8]KAI5892739.1 hypothetical protein SCHCODRAFT_02579404 [Schizophyllum commune H4-8]